MNTKIKFFFEGNKVAETTTNIIGFNNSTLDDLINMITVNFRNPENSTIRSLKIEKWDVVEFDVDGTIYTKTYIMES